MNTIKLTLAVLMFALLSACATVQPQEPRTFYKELAYQTQEVGNQKAVAQAAAAVLVRYNKGLEWPAFQYSQLESAVGHTDVPQKDKELLLTIMRNHHAIWNDNKKYGEINTAEYFSVILLAALSD